MQRTQNIQSSLENKRNLENFKTYYKTTVIKAYCASAWTDGIDLRVQKYAHTSVAGFQYGHQD